MSARVRGIDNATASQGITQPARESLRGPCRLVELVDLVELVELSVRDLLRHRFVYVVAELLLNPHDDGETFADLVDRFL